MNTQRQQDTQRIILLGAISNILLAIVKIYGGLYGHSQALMADGLHSLADLVTDFVVLFATRFSAQKANVKYPYGYARIETLATAVLALLLLITGLGIIYDAGKSLFYTHTPSPPAVFVLVIAIAALILKEILFRYTRLFAKKFQSPLLQANAWHHRSDAASSLIVLVGIIGSLLGFLHLDALASIVVAVMIIKMGWSLTSDSVKELIDVGLDPLTLQAIQQSTLAAYGVRAIHQLRTRSMGGQIFLDMHLLVSPHLTVSEGHYIAAKVHRELMRTIPNLADVTIHVDPENDEEDENKDGTNVLNLPPRDKLFSVLHARWGNLIPQETFKKIRLDYLAGKISITLPIPASHFHDLAAGHALLATLKSKLGQLDYLNKIVVEIEIES